MNMSPSKMLGSQDYPLKKVFLSAIAFVGLLLFIVGIYGIIRRFLQNTEFPLWTDLGLYLKAARIVAEGENPYDLSKYGFDLYVYPPLLADVIAVMDIAFGSWFVWIWVVLCFIIMMASIIVMFRNFSTQFSWHFLTFFVGLVAVSHITRVDIYHGQINFLLLLLLVLGLSYYLDGRKKLSTVLWAFMIVLKPFMGVMVFFLLRRRDWWTAGFVVGASAVIFALSFMPMVENLWSTFFGWLEATRIYAQYDQAAKPDNQSFNGLFIRLFSENPFSVPYVNNPRLVNVLLLPVVGVAVWAYLYAVPAGTPLREPPEQSRQRSLLELGLLIALSLSCGPLSLGDHLFVALPVLAASLMFTARSFANNSPNRFLWVTVCIAWGLAFIVLLSPVRLPFEVGNPDTWGTKAEGLWIFISGRHGIAMMVASLLTAYVIRRDRSENHGHAHQGAVPA